MTGGIVQIGCLGTFGRFGNQLFQYAVARKYAEQHGATLETPAWIGQRLFGLTDPPLSRSLPRMPLDALPWGRTDVDLWGYFVFQDAVKDLIRAELREWFRFKPEWLAMATQPRPYYVAAHRRGGDKLSLKHVFANVSDQSYLDACAKFGLDRNAIVWFSEEESGHRLELDLIGMGWIPDFLTMMQADVLLRAGSSFSWWASTLGTARTFAPLIEDKVGDQTVEFVEGNWPRWCDIKNSGTLSTDMYIKE